VGVLDGNVALVTGAGQGAGLGVALALALEGAAIAVVGRTEPKLQQVVEQIASRDGRALAVRCDVGSEVDIDRAVDAAAAQFGTIDILVNAAHHNSRKDALLDIDDETIELLWTTGPRATLRFMRRCHDMLCGGGAVINFGSGTQFSPQGYGVYAAMKEAISTISLAAAVEWGPDDIRVNVISPLVRSPSMDAGHADPLEHVEEVRARVPLRRIGEPEADIGRVAVFLASDDARYVTGQLVCVDGGQGYHR
jgi:NAD(P)-dependent dehydrogenase (short-subunit alcohol dehydrogenase family)